MGSCFGLLRVILALSVLSCAPWVQAVAQTTPEALPKSEHRPQGRDRAAPDPMYIQAEELRVVAHGNVEIYYKNFILTADRLIYDGKVKELVAEGGVALKDPSGTITRSERMRLTNEFRDAFLASLAPSEGHGQARR